MLRQEKMNIARQVAADGMVLLKNENEALPLSNQSKVALYGIASYRCFRMGWGSGDMLAQKISQINEALEEAGYLLDAEIDEACKCWITDHRGEYENVNRNWDEWTFRFNEIKLDDSLIASSAKRNDVAIITLGRCEGEAADLKNEEGFFKLHSEEVELVKKVSSTHKKTILLLNVCGALDLTEIDDCKIDAIVDVSLGGEMFGYAVADIISGKVTPSGKLAMTWAYKYEDYPTKEGIDSLVVPYNEGIYVGYRYFDTFGKQVRYPFGYGLSYTNFDHEILDVRLDGQIMDIAVKVTNIGKYPGKEVLQCYLSSPDGNLEKAYQDLCAYAKTNTLQPLESNEVVLSFNITDMASFCEKCASFVLEKGLYYVRLGNSSRKTKIVCAINVKETTVTNVVTNRFKANSVLNLISKKGVSPITYENEIFEKEAAQFFELDCNAIEKITSDIIEDKPVTLLSKRSDNVLYTLEDVANGDATVEDVVAQFSNEELATILNGVIYDGADANANVGSMAIKVRGAAGELWSSKKYKIPVNACADGPAGVRLSIFGTPPETDTDLAHGVVAYPSGTCLANTWDLESARCFGECVADDLKYTDIEGWLAPGINIQRNPLNGRNFEYYSEDPLVAGKIGAYVTIGVQYDENAEPTGKYATIKHFACNNIEYERGVSDSQVSERALREIYLKGFKIAVEEGNPRAIMTAYNKINGVFASTNYDLLMGVLRGEWEYDGMVMTDWNTCANAQEHVHACNDLIMPGRYAKKILEGIENGNVKKEEAQLCASRILNLILRTNYAKK